LVGCGLSASSSMYFFFSSRRRHTRFSRDWSSDVCSSDLPRRISVQRGVSELVLQSRVLIEQRFYLFKHNVAPSRVSFLGLLTLRSEERRVGEGCGEWGGPADVIGEQRACTQLAAHVEPVD